ncbi:nucleotide-diphospho-sugar transferase, partial [Mycena sp. CBHHK59/15]
SAHHPKRGIDAFLVLHRGEFDILSAASDYQIMLKKTSEMRIGFLVKQPKAQSPQVEFKTEDALGYGINLAVTADSQFAMAAAVAIRSAVDASTNEGPTRLSIYVVDCGLSADDKRRIEESVPARGNITLVFVELPENGLTHKFGAVWGKVEMISVLPVQRVLYLDADVLVLQSLKDLWRTDLEGKPLGAVRDVGFPNGHDNKGPYFNAGVMLMDLALARQKFAELETLATKEHLRFLDQDALNLHFRGEWTSIGQEWNAQFSAMKAQPRIVHFTGPVHPTMAEVLNPFVKYSAKPWGYASAPNHPFCEHAWNGFRTSEEYMVMCNSKRGEAIENATREFQRVVGAARCRLEWGW